MEILDCIAECLDKEHTLRATVVHSGEVIHRFGSELAHDAAGVARFCRGEPGVGRRMAYSFVVGVDGSVWQALPLDTIGWHAKSISRTHVGIACLGDFRHKRPTDAQYQALVELVGWLTLRRGGEISLLGHDQVKGGSDDPAKECPGKLLDIGDLRIAVTDWLSNHAKQCGPQVIQTTAAHRRLNGLI